MLQLNRPAKITLGPDTKDIIHILKQFKVSPDFILKKHHSLFNMKGIFARIIDNYVYCLVMRLLTINYNDRYVCTVENLSIQLLKKGHLCIQDTSRV